MSTPATPAPPGDGPPHPAAGTPRPRHAGHPGDEVERIVAAPHPPVPAGLTARAAAEGRRLLRRRRLLRTALWLLLAAAAVAALAYLAAHWPAPQPLRVTPPPLDW